MSALRSLNFFSYIHTLPVLDNRAQFLFAEEGSGMDRKAIAMEVVSPTTLRRS